MQKLLKQVHSENHTMVTVASPNDDFICPLCRVPNAQEIRG